MEEARQELSPEEYLQDLNSLRRICLNRVLAFQSHIKCYSDNFYCMECVLYLLNVLETKRDVTKLKNYLSSFLNKTFCSCCKAKIANTKAESLRDALDNYLQKF